MPLLQTSPSIAEDYSQSVLDLLPTPAEFGNVIAADAEESAADRRHLWKYDAASVARLLAAAASQTTTEITSISQAIAVVGNENAVLNSLRFRMPKYVAQPASRLLWQQCVLRALVTEAIVSNDTLRSEHGFILGLLSTLPDLAALAGIDPEDVLHELPNGIRADIEQVRELDLQQAAGKAQVISAAVAGRVLADEFLSRGSHNLSEATTSYLQQHFLVSARQLLQSAQETMDRFGIAPCNGLDVLNRANALLFHHASAGRADNKPSAPHAAMSHVIRTRAMRPTLRDDTFQDAIQRVLSDSRPARSMALVLCQPDGLEEIGEKYGAEMRIAVIKASLKLLRSRIRSDDFVGTLSNNTFAILLQDINPDVARRIAERIRHETDNMLAETSSAVLSTTMSCAVLSFEPQFVPDGDPNFVLERTLTLLGETSGAGGNQVTDSRLTECGSDRQNGLL